MNKDLDEQQPEGLGSTPNGAVLLTHLEQEGRPQAQCSELTVPHCCSYLRRQEILRAQQSWDSAFPGDTARLVLGPGGCSEAGTERAKGTWSLETTAAAGQGHLSWSNRGRNSR